jgi:hypothetical protein
MIIGYRNDNPEKQLPSTIFAIQLTRRDAYSLPVVTTYHVALVKATNEVEALNIYENKKEEVVGIPTYSNISRKDISVYIKAVDFNELPSVNKLGFFYNPEYNWFLVENNIIKDFNVLNVEQEQEYSGYLYEFTKRIDYGKNYLRIETAHYLTDDQAEYLIPYLNRFKETVKISGDPRKIPSPLKKVAKTKAVFLK